MKARPSADSERHAAAKTTCCKRQVVATRLRLRTAANPGLLARPASSQSRLPLPWPDEKGYIDLDVAVHTDMQMRAERFELPTF